MKRLCVLIALFLIPMITPIILNPPVAQATQEEYDRGYNRGWRDAQAGRLGMGNVPYDSSYDFRQGYDDGQRDEAAAEARHASW